MLLGVGSAIIAIALFGAWVSLITLIVGAQKALLPIGLAVLVISLSAFDRSSAKEIFDPTQGTSWKLWTQWPASLQPSSLGCAAQSPTRGDCTFSNASPPAKKPTDALARFDAAFCMVTAKPASGSRFGASSGIVSAAWSSLPAL
jgi:hypothetical protein